MELTRHIGLSLLFGLGVGAILAAITYGALALRYHGSTRIAGAALAFTIGANLGALAHLVWG